MKPTTVVIADDHSMVSKLMAEEINRNIAFNVLYTVTDGSELLKRLNENKQNLPDIILMDIGMKPMDGIEATLLVAQDYPKILVMALTSFEFGDSILKMIRVGAKGYYTKSEPKFSMTQAIQIMQKTGYFYSDIVREFIEDPTKQTNSILSKNDVALTENEIEFLRLASSDYTYEVIAEKMFKSERAVDRYRENLFKKFQVKNRAALVIKALLRGWRKK